MNLTVSVAKCLIFFFNILFLGTGLIVAFTALLVQTLLWNYSAFTGATFLSPPTIIMFIGLAIFVVSLFGCLGVVKGSRLLLVSFSALLFALFIVELIVGGYAYLYSGSLKGELATKMNNSMDLYNSTYYEDITQTWDVMQHDFHCCGEKNATDWIDKMKSVPQSCCADLDISQNCTISKSYHVGCFTVFEKFLQSKSSQLGIIAGGISLAQLLSIIVSMLVARQMSELYEAV